MDSAHLEDQDCSSESPSSFGFPIGWALVVIWLSSPRSTPRAEPKICWPKPEVKRQRKQFANAHLTPPSPRTTSPYTEGRSDDIQKATYRMPNDTYRPLPNSHNKDKKILEHAYVSERETLLPPSPLQWADGMTTPPRGLGSMARWRAAALSSSKSRLHRLPSVSKDFFD